MKVGDKLSRSGGWGYGRQLVVKIAKPMQPRVERYLEGAESVSDERKAETLAVGIRQARCRARL